MANICRACACALTILLAAQSLSAQAPGAADETFKQAQQKLREGNAEEAIALVQKAADADAASVQANTQAGVILDLQGRYADARQYFDKAIAAAPPEEKPRALRNMAMSYAFQRDCSGAGKYQQQAFDLQLARNDYTDAAGAANEVARVCLESNRIEEATAWYRKGYDTALKAADLTPAQKDLWQFRWEHAQARIAARRGQKAEADKHVAAAKAVLDKGTNPEQAPYLPYLVGYVAFYGSDDKTALAELQKANQEDPFILALMAQVHEKLDEDAKAKELYRKILTFTSHNPANAYARSLAVEKLKGQS
jgi:tetratricopeptide (TPR) repeat protein